MRTNKILAHKLYSSNYSKGIILIEDLGDLSFYKILLNKKNKLSVYKKLVDLLIQIQKIKPKSKTGQKQTKELLANLKLIHGYLKYVNLEE